MQDNLNTPDLTAIDLGEALTAEDLDATAALGTWGSAGTFGSGSCPYSTASSGGSASSFG